MSSCTPPKIIQSYAKSARKEMTARVNHFLAEDQFVARDLSLGSNSTMWGPSFSTKSTFDSVGASSSSFIWSFWPVGAMDPTSACPKSCKWIGCSSPDNVSFINEAILRCLVGAYRVKESSWLSESGCPVTREIGRELKGEPEGKVSILS